MARLGFYPGATVYPGANLYPGIPVPARLVLTTRTVAPKSVSRTSTPTATSRT